MKTQPATGETYPKSDLFNKAYKGMKSASKENLPVANEIARKVLCLPIYPNLTIEEQEKVISLIMG
ncbi:DegT/DnrJ/EryC1/StrS family aminotransferase [Serratia fonticola]|uniref:DegT/DnrJ/EryC1/StrS family aminotransferase n=1 Tax=Serratia fonticola TaxID=47917 RepID=UPI003AB0BEAF